MQSITVVAGPLATADDDGIAKSQTPAAKGNLTLDGALVTAGIAELGSLRRVLITAAGDESGNTFTITGATKTNGALTETITGPNKTTAQSVLDYYTVSTVAISGAAAGALKVGTNVVGGSPWVRLDGWASSNVSIQCTVDGVANYTLRQTLDDPNNPTNPVSLASMTWVNSNDSNVVAATATKQSNYLFVPTFAQVVLNSGTGTITATFLQSGVTSL